MLKEKCLVYAFSRWKTIIIQSVCFLVYLTSFRLYICIYKTFIIYSILLIYIAKQASKKSMKPYKAKILPFCLCAVQCCECELLTRDRSSLIHSFQTGTELISKCVTFSELQLIKICCMYPLKHSFI